MYNINWAAISAIGSCATGFTLVFIAYRQKQINERNQKINARSHKIERELRYQAHYSMLILAIRKTLISFEERFNKLIDLYQQNQQKVIDEQKLKSNLMQIPIDRSFYNDFLGILGEAELTMAEEIQLSTKAIFDKLNNIHTILNQLRDEVINHLINVSVKEVEFDKLKLKYINDSDFFNNDFITPLIKIYKKYIPILSSNEFAPLDDKFDAKSWRI